MIGAELVDVHVRVAGVEELLDALDVLLRVGPERERRVGDVLLGDLFACLLEVGGQLELVGKVAAKTARMPGSSPLSAVCGHHSCTVSTASSSDSAQQTSIWPTVGFPSPPAFLNLSMSSP